jgi:hypothetical protein
MVVALIALFIALAGTAWAAGLAKNSVKSKQIKDGAIASVDVADNGLTGTDIDESTLTGVPQSPLADGSVTAPKLADGSVTAPKLAPDAVGSSAIADGTVGNADLGPNAVDSSNVGPASLLLSDLVVTSTTFDFRLVPGDSPPNTCSEAIKVPPVATHAGDISIPVLPATVAENGLMVEGALQDASGSITILYCNLRAIAEPIANFGVFPAYVVRP